MRVGGRVQGVGGGGGVGVTGAVAGAERAPSPRRRPAALPSSAARQGRENPSRSVMSWSGYSNTYVLRIMPAYVYYIVGVECASKSIRWSRPLYTIRRSSAGSGSSRCRTLFCCAEAHSRATSRLVLGIGHLSLSHGHCASDGHRDVREPGPERGQNT